MTASQTRAARSLLGWNLDDLAQKADVQISAIEGVEQEIHDASTLSAIKATFEKAGIIFVGSTGVRLKHDQGKGADAKVLRRTSRQENPRVAAALRQMT